MRLQNTIQAADGKLNNGRRYGSVQLLQSQTKSGLCRVKTFHDNFSPAHRRLQRSDTQYRTYTYGGAELKSYMQELVI